MIWITHGWNIGITADAAIGLGDVGAVLEWLIESPWTAGALEI